MATKTVPNSKASKVHDGAKRPSVKRSTQVAVNAAWDNFLKARPLVERSDLEAMEEVFARHQFSTDRRVTLGTATKSGADLLKIANKDLEGAEMIAEIIPVVSSFAQKIRVLSEIAEAQELRLRMALMERPDMEELLSKFGAQLGTAV